MLASLWGTGLRNTFLVWDPWAKKYVFVKLGILLGLVTVQVGLSLDNVACF